MKYALLSMIVLTSIAAPLNPSAASALPHGQRPILFSSKQQKQEGDCPVVAFAEVEAKWVLAKDDKEPWICKANDAAPIVDGRGIDCVIGPEQQLRVNCSSPGSAVDKTLVVSGQFYFDTFTNHDTLLFHSFSVNELSNELVTTDSAVVFSPTLDLLQIKDIRGTSNHSAYNFDFASGTMTTNVEEVDLKVIKAWKAPGAAK